MKQKPRRYSTTIANLSIESDFPSFAENITNSINEQFLTNQCTSKIEKCKVNMEPSETKSTPGKVSCNLIVYDNKKQKIGNGDLTAIIDWERDSKIIIQEIDLLFDKQIYNDISKLCKT